MAVLVVELGLRDPSLGLDLKVPVPEAAMPVVERLRTAPLTGIDDSRAAAIASGVVFGRTDHVTAADEAAFLDSGLWHLLAASGQNIALVAGCCVVLARGVGAGRTIGAVMALVAIPAYVMVVGGGASIVRAGIMGELALLAWLAGRLSDVRHMLISVAAIICWAWPGAHRGLGMQLSFACVAALALWAVPATRWLCSRGVPTLLAGAVTATLLCSAATAPILFLRTGAAPLLGTVANIVAVPIAGCILVVGLLGSLIAIGADSAGAPRIADSALAPVGWLSSVLLEVGHRAADLPAAQTSSWAAAIGAPLLALVWSRIPRGRVGLRAAAVWGAALCVAVPMTTEVLANTPVGGVLGSGGDPPPPGTLRIGVLDVGQGDATLLATSDQAILVDTGPPEGRVVQRVRELGYRRVDGIVLTHDSLDHRGGFEAAVASLEPDWVAIPRHAMGNWARVRQASPNVVELCAGDELTLAGTTVDVLHPRCDGSVTPHTGDLHNDAALVLLARHDDISALLPADAEAPVLLELGLPDVDLLRVAHHGSADEELPRLLRAVTPAAAAVSVGADNGYGHPDGGTMRTLATAGVATFRTDRNGTLVFDSDGGSLSLHDD